MALSFCCEEVVVSVSQRWVSFDCFGTLVDWQAWFTEVLGPLGGHTENMVRAYHAHERLAERESPQPSYKDVLVTGLTRAAAEGGVRLSRRDARGIVMQSWSSLQVFADVEPMLAELRSNGYRLAVLTNCDEDLFAVTHRLFNSPFDLCLTSERIRGYKPARWHFRGFEMLTGVARPNWVHVANSWYHDIEPARSLGLNHVWLDRDRTGEDGGPVTVRVNSAVEAPSAVARLFARSSVLLSQPGGLEPDRRMASFAAC
jgi:2-haloacid dehalogenase